MENRYRMFHHYLITIEINKSAHLRDTLRPLFQTRFDAKTAIVN